MNNPWSHLLIFSVAGAMSATSLTLQGWVRCQPAHMAQPDPFPSTNMCCTLTRAIAYRWHPPHCTAVQRKGGNTTPGARMNPAARRNKVLQALQHTHGVRASQGVARTNPWKVRFARFPIRRLNTRRCLKSLSPQSPSCCHVGCLVLLCQGDSWARGPWECSLLLAGHI